MDIFYKVKLIDKREKELIFKASDNTELDELVQDYLVEFDTDKGWESQGISYIIEKNLLNKKDAEKENIAIWE